MLKCLKCGYKNADDAKICNLCSNKLDPSTVKRSGPAPAAAADAFMFEPRMLGGGGIRKAGQTQTQQDRHYLVPATGEPARMDPGTTYLVGREETAQIRINSPRVSRKHVEIKFEGGKPSLFDMGSQNGTIVNGMKLASKAQHVLKDKDTIEVGGVLMTYRYLKPGDPESKLKEGGSEVTMVEPEVGGSSDADLTGNVALMPIGDVLVRLSRLGATGLLLIDAAGNKGAIRVEKGKAMAGSYAGLDGEAAISAVRALAQGKFKFEMQDPDAPMTEVHVKENGPYGAPKPGAPRPPKAF
jgi:hypothetical protein